MSFIISREYIGDVGGRAIKTRKLLKTYGNRSPCRHVYFSSNARARDMGSASFEPVSLDTRKLAELSLVLSRYTSIICRVPGRDLVGVSQTPYAQKKQARRTCCLWRGLCWSPIKRKRVDLWVRSNQGQFLTTSSHRACRWQEGRDRKGRLGVYVGSQRDSTEINHLKHSNGK